MKKGLVFTALIAAFGIGLAACGQTPAAPKEYVVTIANKTALQEEWKDTPEDFRTAAVTIKGKNHDEVVDFYEAVDAGDLKFTSSETSVLTVAGYGIITCQGAGKSTITATYKNEFSDSVEITVSQEEAIRPAFTLDTSKEYWLGLTPSDGITQYATGKTSSYYLATDKLSKAATATVAIDPEATDDFKYVITLSYKDGEKTESKVIGSAFNENDKGKHYNIGFVGSKVSGSDIEFVKALFKFDTQTHQFTTMVAEDATTLVECKMGTSGTYKTLQYGPVSENKITYPAYLYEEGDPIHPETLVINGESEITLRPGFSTKLEYTCTPDFVTDNAKWSSDNMAAVTVDEGTGYVSAVGASGTSANITVKVYRKSATVKVKVQGEGLEYGTATAPLTVAQAKAQLDDLGDNGVTVFKMYVRGEISEVENYDTTYGNRNVWLKDGETAKGFELYRLKDGETPAEVKTEDLLAGQTITAAGYATKYVTGTGDSQKITYEFTPSQGFNPQPVKVEVPDLTGIDAEDITVVKDAEADVVVSALPQGAILPTVSLAWEDAEQDVAQIVTGELKVKGLKKGSTNLVITAGDKTKTIKVTVTETATVNFELVTTTTLTSGKYAIGALGKDDATKYYYLGAPTAEVEKNPATSGPLTDPTTELELKDAWDFTVTDGHIVISYTSGDDTYYLEASNAAQGIKITKTQTAGAYWTLNATGLNFSAGGSRYMATYNDGSFRNYTAPLTNGQSMANVFYHYIGE